MIFITLNDGSTLHNLQLVVTPSQLSEDILANINTGASICALGTIVASPGQAQKIELHTTQVTLLGSANDYPLQPKKHSLSFLREIAHLRFRTNTFSSVFRIRHLVSFAIHQFFHERGFLYLHTPIITGADAEGAGEVFNVTTLNAARVPKTTAGEVDYGQDFFEKKTNLTVSGQLEAEAAALGLSAVYTFGPTFRAENSNTTRHLAEFWMIEPEMAFYDLSETIDLAESLLKHIVQTLLIHCPDELAFLQKREQEAHPQKQTLHSKLPLIERLKAVVAQSWERISYTKAIEILRGSKPNKKGKFAYPIQEWGVDLQAEHERYLVEQHFEKPVVITDYPKANKAFYMRQNADEKTVAAMDLLLPGIGEVVGGSEREERLDQLKNAIQRNGIETSTLQWYLDTRRFGTAPHSGFGLGLERLVQFVTGMENIRDVIPFPRTPGHAEF